MKIIKHFTDNDLSSVRQFFEVGYNNDGEIFVGEIQGIIGVKTANYCAINGWSRGVEYHISEVGNGSISDIRKIFTKYFEICRSALDFLEKYKTDHKSINSSQISQYYMDVVIKVANQYIAKFCEAKSIDEIDAMVINFSEKINYPSMPEA